MKGAEAGTEWEVRPGLWSGGGGGSGGGVLLDGEDERCLEENEERKNGTGRKGKKKKRWHALTAGESHSHLAIKYSVVSIKWLK
jgi:hypothetical protein